MKALSAQAKKNPVTERFESAVVLMQRAETIQDPLPKGQQVVEVLKSLRLDEDILIAALLADRRLANSLEIAQINEQFGDTIA
ncbi:MAG: hypothetical protein DSZ28_09725, partial [Thiothrix sp.]